MKKIVNCETGEELEVELSKEDIAQQKKDEKEWLAGEAEIAAKLKAKTDILAKLGLTPEEALLILG